MVTTICVIGICILVTFSIPQNQISYLWYMILVYFIHVRLVLYKPDSYLNSWPINLFSDWVCIKGPSIVVVTLSTAVHLTKTATLRGYFSHIVIDEAGQALETEAIIPLALATEDTSVVLAGDPKQMSPQVKHKSNMRKLGYKLLYCESHK